MHGKRLVTIIQGQNQDQNLGGAKTSIKKFFKIQISIYLMLKKYQQKRGETKEPFINTF